MTLSNLGNRTVNQLDKYDWQFYKLIQIPSKSVKTTSVTINTPLKKNKAWFVTYLLKGLTWFKLV